jgi:hypothetical protein
MLADRMFRAAMLDSLVFDEIKEDRESMGQAAQVIAIVTAIGVISALVQALYAPAEAATDTDFVTNLAFTAATTIIGWLIWSILAYLIGTGVFGGAASYAEVLRGIAFAQSPSVITILAIPLVFIPFAGAVLGGILGFVAALWVLIVNVIATRQTLGIGTGKATITTIVIAIVMIVAFIILSYLLFPEAFEIQST